MTEQLQLLPDRGPTWPLPDEVRRTGLAGVQQARAALRAAAAATRDERGVGPEAIERSAA